MSTIEPTAVGPTQNVEAKWRFFGQGSRRYRCPVYVRRETDGYSAHCPQLMGAVSQGSTIEEAFSNICEALTGLIESYTADHQAVPWESEFAFPPDAAAIRWISVNG